MSYIIPFKVAVERGCTVSFKDAQAREVLVRSRDLYPWINGWSVRILGKIDAIEDLPERGETGDGWILMEDEEYHGVNYIAGDMFIWDSDLQAWIDIGPIVGPRGYVFTPSYLESDPWTLHWENDSGGRLENPPDLNLLPRVRVGLVERLNYDQDPTVVVHPGSAPDDITLDFGIPKGVPGNPDLWVETGTSAEATETTVNINSTVTNLGTLAPDTTVTPLPAVTVSYAGVMDPALYQELKQNTLDIAALQNGLEGFPRTAVVAGLGSHPSDADLSAAFDGAFPGHPAVPGDKILVYDTEELYIYANAGHWVEIDNTAVGLATDSNAGLVQHSTLNGSIGFYVAGIGQVNGWDDLVARVRALELNGVNEELPPIQVNQVSFGDHGDGKQRLVRLFLAMTEPGAQFSVGQLMHFGFTTDTGTVICRMPQQTVELKLASGLDTLNRTSFIVFNETEKCVEYYNINAIATTNNDTALQLDFNFLGEFKGGGGGAGGGLWSLSQGALGGGVNNILSIGDPPANLFYVSSNLRLDASQLVPGNDADYIGKEFIFVKAPASGSVGITWIQNGEPNLGTKSVDLLPDLPLRLVIHTIMHNNNGVFLVFDRVSPNPQPLTGALFIQSTAANAAATSTANPNTLVYVP